MAKKKTANNTNSYVVWRRSTTGGLIFAGVYFLLGYVFVSLAIDSGSLWQYGLAILSVIMGIQSIFIMVKNRGNGYKK